MISNSDFMNSYFSFRNAAASITAYRSLGTLKQIIDEESIVVEEELLVTKRTSDSMVYRLRIVELRDVAKLTTTLREIEHLKKIGREKGTTSLVCAFRHRQYVGLLLPADNIADLLGLLCLS